MHLLLKSHEANHHLGDFSRSGARGYTISQND